jgi:gliding motility-associated-like protein
MNNGYDSVFRNIPVNFYDADPYSGRPAPLDSTFYTPDIRPGACDSFFAVINSPGGDILYAGVNDKGRGSFPDQGFAETDTKNNTDQARVEKFIVSVKPQDTVVYRNTTVQLRARATDGRIASYTWSPSGTLSCINCLDPVARAPYSQLIIFNAKNQNACTSSDTADVKTYSDGPVNIPNAFTPNGDGKNDVFYILGSRDIQSLKDFAVYDRYGQKIFQVRNVPPNDPVYGWRGLSGSGTALPQGTYAYSVMIVFKDGREQLFKGTITMIR